MGNLEWFFRKMPLDLKGKDMLVKRKFLSLVLSIVMILSLCSYKAPTKPIPILMYHSCKENYPVENSSLYVTPEAFEQQIIDILEMGYTFVNFYEVLDYMNGTGTLPEKPIILTFDDGYLDNYVNVYPILQKYNAKATIFVVTSALNDEDVEYNEDEIQYMTWKQAIEMQNSGLVNIESHTHNHYNLMNLTESEVYDELILSKNMINSKMGKDTFIISLPFGAGNSRIAQQCRDAGYEMVSFVYPQKINYINSGTKYVSRISVDTNTDLHSVLK